MYVDNYGPRCVLAPVRCLRSTPRPTSSSARAYLFWNLQKRALGSTRFCFPFRPLSFFRSKSFRSVLAFAGGKTTAALFRAVFDILYFVCKLHDECCLYFFFCSRGLQSYLFPNLLFFIPRSPSAFAVMGFFRQINFVRWKFDSGDLRRQRRRRRRRRR